MQIKTEVELVGFARAVGRVLGFSPPMQSGPDICVRFRMNFF
jgi:hypothetical protein